MDDRKAALLLATVTPPLLAAALATQLLWHSGAALRASAALLTIGLALGAGLAALPTRTRFPQIVAGLGVACVTLLAGRITVALAAGARPELAGLAVLAAGASALLAGLGLVWWTNRRWLR